MASLDEYQDKYRSISFERREGILEIRLHGPDGGPYIFDEQSHHDFGRAFADAAEDTGNRVVILTGTGDTFCTHFDYGGFVELIKADANEAWSKIRSDGRRMLQAFLDIEVPVIAAINGPVVTHSELPVLADVVLAAEDTFFQDATHFATGGFPPGDGMNIVWTTLLGLNRGRYFLMTGERLSVREAHRLGVVAEVLPRDQLLTRAWELARQWTRSSNATLRGTRSSLNSEWRRLMSEQLYATLSYEALAGVAEPLVEMPTPSIVDLAAGSLLVNALSQPTERVRAKEAG
jgi:enoyl-CoA hydratase/carnithine racemase